MTYIEMKREVSIRGKRKSQTRISPFDISDNLWEHIQKYAEESNFCSIGKYDWNEGTLYIARTKEFDELLKQHCNAPEDYKMFDEARKTINIEFKEMAFKYEYVTEVVEVDLENRTATVKKHISRRDFNEWMKTHTSPPPVKTYKVPISDRCIYEKIKPKDTVLIRKFLNDVFLAVQVYESYQEPTQEEIEKKLKEWDDLMEDY